MRAIKQQAIAFFIALTVLAMSGYPQIGSAIIKPSHDNIWRYPNITSVYNKTLQKNNVLRPGDEIEITGTRLYGINGKTLVHFARKIDDAKPWKPGNVRTLSATAKIVNTQIITLIVPKVEGASQGSLRITNYRVIGRLESSPVYPVQWEPISPPTPISPTLSITLAEDNAVKAPSVQITGGTQGVQTMYLTFNPKGEDVQLRFLKLNLANLSAADSVSSVQLYNASSTKIADGTYIESTGEATFGNGQTTFYTFPKDIFTTLTVVTDARGVGNGTATADSGDEIKWTVDAEIANDFTNSIIAFGAASNMQLRYDSNKTESQILFGEGSSQQDIIGNIFHIRRARMKDLIALKLGTTTPADGSTTTLTNGNGIEIFRFQIFAAPNSDNANSNGAIDLTALDLSLYASGVTITNAKFYRTDDASVVINANASTTTASRIVFDSTGASKLTSLSLIAPGQNAIFAITADVSDAGQGDMLQVSIGNLGAQTTEGITDLSTGDIAWSDNDDIITDDLTSWVSWQGIAITNVAGQTRVFPST